MKRAVESGRTYYFQGGCWQSEADCEGISSALYIHALFGMLTQVPLGRVALIGAGGGTLATLLVRLGVSVVAVDINPEAFEIARDHFHLPSEVECVAADGANFLEGTSERFDAVVLDAYNGPRIPRRLLRADFLQTVSLRLTNSGLFLANIFENPLMDFTADSLAAKASLYWPDVRILCATSEFARHSILVAGPHVNELRQPHLVIRPRCGSNQLEQQLANSMFRKIRLARFFRAVNSFHCARDVSSSDIGGHRKL